MSNHRIHHIHIDGTVIKSFGDLWIPEYSVPGNVGVFNQEFLLPRDSDSFLAVWLFQPLIEVWSKTGIKLEEHPMSVPEVIEKQKVVLPEGQYMVYVTSASTIPDSPGSFLIRLASDPSEFIAYEIDNRRLRPIRKLVSYHGLPIRLFTCVVLSSHPDLIMSIDGISDTIVVLERVKGGMQ
jgi:hypothetical protein